MYKKYFKRFLDFFIALIAIIALFPVLVFIAFLVRLKLGSPILFRQKRPGLNEQIFTMYKFRTMSNKRGLDGEALPDSIRLTNFGKRLRATSLDELPELFNILKGEMSIVGPRPLLVNYLGLYNEQQKRRHEVRPGLTGLAQVNGRNSITWDEKFRLDILYIDNISFILDCKIIFDTIKKVFIREGITSENSETMEEFKGSKGREG
ncbi:sugar transferase [Macellibacteroides fermentans]|uniref:sugar transferase n=1 Tax=Macellibacteroides fermentans TaxID=879969 RepID=UPI00406CB8E4